MGPCIIIIIRANQKVSNGELRDLEEIILEVGEDKFVLWIQLIRKCHHSKRNQFSAVCGIKPS